MAIRTVIATRLGAAIPRTGRSILLGVGIILLIPLLVTSCSSKGPYQLDLMPAPKIYSEKEVNPFDDDIDAQEIPYNGILYATDRLPINGDSKQDFYENERGFILRFGLGKIKLGKQNLSWEQAREVSLLKNRGKDYPLQVTGIEEFGVLDSSRSGLWTTEREKQLASGNRQFARLINKKLATSKQRDVMIYVHGYKVVFSNPVLVTAELWHFLGYDGVAVAFAWPSTPSRWAYAKDLETAVDSSRNLRLLIEYLAKETNVRRINIVAYSAGTRVAVNALAQLTLLNHGKSSAYLQQQLRIGDVILVGSDFDRSTFVGYMEDGMLNLVRRFTVYMSDTDKALAFSNFLLGRRRLGQAFDPGEMDSAIADYLRHSKKLFTIDVTGAEEAATGNGHAYFRKSPWVSSDVLMTLKYDLQPNERGLVQHDTIPSWRFPEDYSTRLSEQLQKKLGLNQ